MLLASLLPLLAALHKAGLSPVAAAVWVVVGIIALVVLFLVFRNFHRQRDFERSDHIVPEDYD
jgi:hypothetical protein